MNRHTEVDTGGGRGDGRGSREDGHADSRCRGEHATAKELKSRRAALALGGRMREDEGGGQKEQYGFLEFVGVNVQRGRELAGERGGEKAAGGGGWQLVSPCSLARSCVCTCVYALHSLARARARARAQTHAYVRENEPGERERGRERKVIHCSAETNSRAPARAFKRGPLARQENNRNFYAP